MTVSSRRNVVSVCLLVASLLPAQARAQNWSFDARAVGLGGVGSTSNVAVDMVDEQRPYCAIVLPFGLLQVIPNLPKLDPTKDEFDLVRAIEYSASPIHFILGATTRRPGLLHHRPSEWRDGLRSQLLSGIFAGDERVGRRPGVSELGAHVQAESENQWVLPGYLRGRRSVLLDADVCQIDPALAAVFTSPTPVYTPNTSYYMSNDTLSQFALAVPAGTAGASAGREEGSSTVCTLERTTTISMASVRAFRALGETRHQRERFADCQSQPGLAVLDPPSTSSRGPWLCDRHGGRCGCRSLGGRLRRQRDCESHGLDKCQRTDYVLDSLFSGGDFVDLPTTQTDDARVELPVDIRANGAYHSDVWMGIVEYGHGYNGTTSAPGTSSGSTGSSSAAASGTSRNVGSRPAASVSTFGRVRRRCRGVRDERQSRTETSHGDRRFAAAHAPQSIVALRTIRKISGLPDRLNPTPLQRFSHRCIVQWPGANPPAPARRRGQPHRPARDPPSRCALRRAGPGTL